MKSGSYKFGLSLVLHFRCAVPCPDIADTEISPLECLYNRSYRGSNESNMKRRKAVCPYERLDNFWLGRNCYLTFRFCWKRGGHNCRDMRGTPRKAKAFSVSAICKI